jgi:hypothetical protein
MCKNAGMIAHASFIVGLPGETRETLAQTEEFAKSLGILYGYHFLAPFPGTTIREKVEKYDLQIMTDDWTKYDANDAIVRTEALSQEEMREFVARYDKEVDDDWQRQLRDYKTGKNTELQDLQIEGQTRMNLSYQILTNDLIEKYGFIESSVFQGSSENALDRLCERITIATNTDSIIVKKTISNYTTRGYLKTASHNGDCIWSWSG